MSADAPEVADELESRIASVLHRLRTPLTAIKGWTHISRKANPETPAAELAAYLDQTMCAVNRMQEAIDVIEAEGRAWHQRDRASRFATRIVRRR